MVLVGRKQVGKRTAIFGGTSEARMTNLDLIRKLQADAAANGDGLAADFARRAADRLESLGEAFANGILAELRYDLYAHFAPAGTILTYSEFMERRLGAGDDDPYGARNLEQALDYEYVRALAEQTEDESDAHLPDEG